MLAAAIGVGVWVPILWGRSALTPQLSIGLPLYAVGSVQFDSGRHLARKRCSDAGQSNMTPERGFCISDRRERMKSATNLHAGGASVESSQRGNRPIPESYWSWGFGVHAKVFTYRA